MIRRAIEQDTYSSDSLQVRVTISIGLALRSTLDSRHFLCQSSPSVTGKRQEQILARLADKSLYHAKKTGRNRVVEWPFEDVTYHDAT